MVSERRRGLGSLLGARHLSTTLLGRARRRGAAVLASLLPIAISVAAASAAAASDAVRPSIDAGDRAWSRRAEGAEGDRAAPGPIAEAIAAYEAALAADPRSLEALWKLERALHFQGQFTAMSAADRERVWERGTELAERSLAVLHGDEGWEDREPATRRRRASPTAPWAPRCTSGRRCTGACGARPRARWPRCTRASRSASAITRLIAIALDETFERGGPRRLLGRLHAVAPRVPFFTGWVSRTEGVEHLERAVAIAPEDLANRLYLAEARLELEPAHRDQALREIEAVVAAAPAPDHLVEDRRVQVEARATLERARDDAP